MTKGVSLLVHPVYNSGGQTPCTAIPKLVKVLSGPLLLGGSALWLCFPKPPSWGWGDKRNRRQKRGSSTLQSLSLFRPPLPPSLYSSPPSPLPLPSYSPSLSYSLASVWWGTLRFQTFPFMMDWTHSQNKIFPLLGCFVYVFCYREQIPTNIQSKQMMNFP